MALRPPVTWRNHEEHRRKIAQSIWQLMDGHTNAAGSVTLTASTTSTVVTDDRVGIDSVITFMPTSSNGASALTNLYVTSRGDGTFTLTHSSSAATDQDLEYAIHGTGRS